MEHEYEDPPYVEIREIVVDGIRKKIYEKTDPDNVSFPRFKCLLCGVTDLQGEALVTHEKGKKHQKKIENHSRYRTPSVHNHDFFLNNIKFSKMIEHAEDQNKPLIGCEYVVEIVSSSSADLTFCCVLCDKTCDLRTIFMHLVSHRHRMFYLNKHFSKFMQRLSKHSTFYNDMIVREEMLTSFSMAIQKEIGLTQPMICEKSNYNGQEKNIKEYILEMYHFSENEWPQHAKKFEKIVQKFKNVDESSSESDEDHFDQRHNVLRNIVMSSRKNPEVEKLSQLSLGKGVQDSKREIFDNISRYSQKVESETKKLNELFENYKKSPECHPQYSSEWREFWARKYKELVMNGKDANEYNYKPEWITYWTNKMLQIHLDEIESVKEKVRIQLGLTQNELEQIEQSRGTTSKRQPTKQDDSSPEPKKYKPAVTKPDNSKTVAITTRLIPVCRFLCALEFELGTLAESVLNLLAKAVRNEQAKQNTAEDLLSEPENYNMLETVKEKLKGVLLVNVISSEKMKAVKSAIEMLETMLNENRRNHPMKPEKIKKVLVHDDDEVKTPIDELKKEITRVVIENLEKEGKNDISDEDLESLVEEIFKETEKCELAMETAETSTTNTDEEQFEKLDDEDFITLLRNFSELTGDEQKLLLDAVEKLEPERLNLLKPYLNMSDE